MVMVIMSSFQNLRMIYAPTFITNILLILSILLFQNGFRSWKCRFFIFFALSLSLFLPLVTPSIREQYHSQRCLESSMSGVQTSKERNGEEVCGVSYCSTFHMMEWIKCNHLTDRWKQFKSISTLAEYELGNSLFCYSVLFGLRFTIFTTWQTFSIGYYFCCPPLPSSPHPPKNHLHTNSRSGLWTSCNRPLVALPRLAGFISDGERERERAEIIRVLQAS